MSASMRAVVAHGLGSLDEAGVADVAVPEPGAGEVLVEVHAAPVNYVDVVTLSGEYQFTPDLPYVPGKGPAGVVAALGPGVSGVAVGDRVLAMAEYGGYAQYSVADARQVHPLPEGLSFVDAAAMSLAFDTAWMALRERGRLAAGEAVLVLGASGAVGRAAVQLARLLGAGTVVAAASSPARLATMADVAADAVIDLSQPDLRERIPEQVRTATGGTGADVVIDPLGGDPFDGAVRAVAWRGRLVVVGFAAGRIPTLRANYLLLKNIEVSGLQISDYRRRAPDLVARAYEEVFDLHAAGRLRAPSSTTLPLDGWREALEGIRTRRTRGRTVLLPWG